MPTLPPELVSLVHHVELNRVGWWERAVQRLILSALWFKNCCMTISQIKTELNQNSWGIKLSSEQLEEHIFKLCESEMLIEQSANQFKISIKTHKHFERDINRVQLVEKAARRYFIELLDVQEPSLASNKMWEDFLDKFLLPLIKKCGARVYELLTGAGQFSESEAQINDYLANYKKVHRNKLKAVCEQFLSSTDDKVKEYVLRHLNAYFFVEASSLKNDDLKSITNLANLQPRFIIFIDTNFLLSILGMHSTPYVKTAISLLKIAKKLSDSASILFYVLPETIKEAKGVLRGYQHELSELRLTRPLAEVALEAHLSDISRWFINECLEGNCKVGANEYFEPYIRNLINILRDRGIELYNKSLSDYHKHEDVMEDIQDQKRYEERRYSNSAKSIEQLRHDISIWHFIRHKRPAFDESPIEAEYWIVTEDFRFLGFDKFKPGILGNDVPICVHPTTIIQMLQLWIPRTPEFEEALLSSVLLPALSEEFDPSSERVTVDILRAISRFENIEDLSKETISAFLLDQAVRQRIKKESNKEKHVELIKESLIHENMAKEKELKDTLNKQRRLKTEIEEKEDVIQTLQSKMQGQQAELQELQNHLTQENEKSVSLSEKLTTIEQTLLEKDKAKELWRSRKGFLLKGGLYLVIGIVLSIIIASLLSKFVLVSVELALGINVSIWILVFLYIVDNKGSKKDFIAEWNSWKRITKFRKWIFGIIGSIILGLVTKALWELLASASKTLFGN